MRILLVVRPSAGGIRTHVRSLSAGLIERGHSVTIAAPQDFDISLAEVRQVAVPITSRPNPFLDLRAASITANAARDCDLIQGHGLRGAWIAALAAWRSGKPFVFTAHNLIPPSPGLLARMSLRYVLSRATAAICVSNAIANGLRPYASPGARIEVIPNGIDVSMYEGSVDRGAVAAALGLPNAATAEGARWIVSVGRLSPEKGFGAMVRIGQALRDTQPPVYVIIAGDGPERCKLEAEIASHSLEQSVFLPGYVHDVPALLRAADIVVVPSLQEGQGIVALEAMAAGVPVVASQVGGLIETVADAGVLVPPDSGFELAAACLELLANDDHSRTLAQAGRARVKEHYSLDKMVDRNAALYDCLVAS